MSRNPGTINLCGALMSPMEGLPAGTYINGTLKHYPDEYGWNIDGSEYVYGGKHGFSIDAMNKTLKISSIAMCSPKNWGY